MPFSPDLTTLGAFVDVLRNVLVLPLFVLSAIFVMLIVLVQEGKGGGISGAFGGAGAETFGVKAGTVNAFTSWVAAAFLGLALIYAGLNARSGADVEASTRSNVEDFAQPSGSGEEGAPTDGAASTPPSESAPADEEPAPPADPTPGDDG